MKKLLLIICLLVSGCYSSNQQTSASSVEEAEADVRFMEIEKYLPKCNTVGAKEAPACW